MPGLFEYETKEEYEFVASDAPPCYKNTFKGGQKALGDPDNKQLELVEELYGIPAKKREIIFRQFCPGLNEGYLHCKKMHRFTKYFRCANLTRDRNNCILRHWDDPGLHEQAVEEYLENRTQIRRTGMIEDRNIVSSDYYIWDQYRENLDKGVWTLIKEALIGIVKHPEKVNDSERKS